MLYTYISFMKVLMNFTFSQAFEDAVSASEAVEVTETVEEGDKLDVDQEVVGVAVSEADTT